MQVLDLTYINENSKVEELVQFSVGTVDEQASVTRAWNYVENKLRLEIDKETFYDESVSDYVFPSDFVFLTLNLLECFWLTKDLVVDMNTKKSTSKKVDDVSESSSWKDAKDMFAFHGIPCDEDTLAALLWYSQNYWVGNMSIDLSDVL